MRIEVAEFPVESGATSGFSHSLLQRLGAQLTKWVKPSEMFTRKYSKDFSLFFWLSAKAGLAQPELAGPGVYRRAKNVEYSIFLPHEGRPPKTMTACKEPLRLYLEGIVKVMQSLEIDTRLLEAKLPGLIERVMSNPKMFDELQPMRIILKQAYRDRRVSYPFNRLFYHEIGLDLTEHAKPTEAFVQKYGETFDVVFNIDAKVGLTKVKLNGPKVFKGEQRIQFSIYLPHDGRTTKSEKDSRVLLPQFFDSVIAGLRKVGVDADEIEEDADYLVDGVSEGWFGEE